MFYLKNVVAKLWMTIIGLVAVVLLILGLFLFNFIDNSFPKANDQRNNMYALAAKIVEEAAGHQVDLPAFTKAMNDVLGVDDAGMVILEKGKVSPAQPFFYYGEGPLKIGDVLSESALNELFAGQTQSFDIAKTKAGTKEDYIALAAPLQFKGDTGYGGAIVLYQSLKSVESTQEYVKKLFAIVSFIGFLLTTFFAFFLITRITRPLLQLKTAADLIAQGEYGTRVPVVSSDEIGQLGKTFNLMGERLETTITDLNHEKENLGSVLRSMADTVLSFDIEGNVIFTNPHGEDLLREWSDIGWEDSDSGASSNSRKIPEPLRQIYEEVISETKEKTSKLNVTNGVWSVVMAPLYSRDAVRGVVAVLRDVTEEFRLEKLRKDFVANVSHELRTPLSMLQGYSEALLDDIAATPEERKELAQIIYDESLRMGRLVKDLLDLARMEAGHIDFQFRTLPLQPLLKRVQRKFTALVKERGIQLVPEWPEQDIVLSYADEDRLEQVLTNLLDNAIRHTPPDAHIYLRANAEATSARVHEHTLLLEIEDRGKGIPAEDLPFVFERFYKADKARTRGASGGTGLGLAIVRNIVEAHRGKIAVRSSVGHGTTFSIRLPL